MNWRPKERSEYMYLSIPPVQSFPPCSCFYYTSPHKAKIGESKPLEVNSFSIPSIFLWLGPAWWLTPCSFIEPYAHRGFPFCPWLSPLLSPFWIFTPLNECLSFLVYSELHTSCSKGPAYNSLWVVDRQKFFKPWLKNGLGITRRFFSWLIKTIMSLSISGAAFVSPEGRETLFLSPRWHASHWLLCHTMSGPWPEAAWKRTKALLTFAMLNTWRNLR